MAGISVEYIWGARHTPINANLPVNSHHCHEYGGGLGFDACVRFRVAFNAVDKQAAYDAHLGSGKVGDEKVIFWVHQTLTQMGTFYDARGVECLKYPITFNEYFSVGPTGHCAQDHHALFSRFYGPKCELVCREMVTVGGSLKIVRTSPLALGAGTEVINVNEDGSLPSPIIDPPQGRSAKQSPNRKPVAGHTAMQSLHGLEYAQIAAATDVAGTAAAQALYGSTKYGYNVDINHCGDVEGSREVERPGNPSDPIGVSPIDGSPVYYTGETVFAGPQASPPDEPPSAEVPGSGWQENSQDGKRPIDEQVKWPADPLDRERSVRVEPNPIGTPGDLWEVWARERSLGASADPRHHRKVD